MPGLNSEEDYLQRILDECDNTDFETDDEDLESNDDTGKEEEHTLYSKRISIGFPPPLGHVPASVTLSSANSRPEVEGNPIIFS